MLVPLNSISDLSLKNTGIVLWFSCGQQQKRHVAAPAHAGVRRRMKETGRKLVHRDKGSLTEQQTNGTVTATIQIRGIHNTNRTTHRAASATAHSRVGCSHHPVSPHRNSAWRHMVWNTLLCLARWGQPAWLCPLPGFQWKLTLSWPNPGQIVMNTSKILFPTS